MHTIADCLSGNPVNTPSADDLHGEAEIEHCQQVLMALARDDDDTGEHILPDLHLTRIREEVLHDQEYTKLMETIQGGFPADKKQLDLDLHPFWAVREELAILHGVVTLGQRLVIPKRMRPTVLKQLHKSHQGQTRTLRRALQSLHLPNITNDIRQMAFRPAWIFRLASTLPLHMNVPLRVNQSTRPF